MIKKTMLASCVLVASMTSQAALISYNGYERDTAKNYVTGGGLEWLMWNVTLGMSINDANNTYAAQGWRLASNREIASLFNQFKFDKGDWNINDADHQWLYTPWNSTEDTGAHYSFLKLFGETIEHKCKPGETVYCFAPNDAYRGSRAIFGSDSLKRGLYSLAYVYDDSTYFLGPGYDADRTRAEVAMIDGHVTKDLKQSTLGVAMVRSIVRDPVAVPTPGPIGLLALGLLALGYRRRQVLGR